MPLDTGGVADLRWDAESSRALDGAETYAPTLQSAADIGQALKAVREHRSLSLEQVAEITRIRRAYLADIEAMRLEKLPSRPFTIGYIRAYAQALGLDGDAAVERFKAEEPMLDEPLRGPLGVDQGSDPRVVAIVAGVVVIVAAIIIWNVAQRAMSANAPPSPTAPASAAARALEDQRSGPLALGAPLPAPVESTTPAPYETPGLAAAGADGVNHSAPARLGVRADGQAAVDPATLPPMFIAKGVLFGAPAGQPSSVTLQALKSASLIVCGADGSIYFARQFAAGEAYRAPQLAGLTADVSEPDSFQVFVAGRSRGVLPAAQASLNKLAE